MYFEINSTFAKLNWDFFFCLVVNYVMGFYGLFAHIVYINSFVRHSSVTTTASLGLNCTVRRCGGGKTKAGG